MDPPLQEWRSNKYLKTLTSEIKMLKIVSSFCFSKGDYPVAR